MKCNRCGRDNCRSLFEHVRDDRTSGPDWQATARAWEDCAEVAGKRAVRAEAALIDLRASLREALERDEDAQREALMRSRP